MDEFSIFRTKALSQTQHQQSKYNMPDYYSRTAYQNSHTAVEKE